MYKMITYNGDIYSTYEEAKADGATYSTGSYIDALEIESSTTALQDIIEIIECIEDMLGDAAIRAGFVNDNSEFMTLAELLEEIEKRGY